jgi:hypothetical protein
LEHFRKWRVMRELGKCLADQKVVYFGASVCANKQDEEIDVNVF